GQQVTAVDADLQAREDEDARALARLPEDRVPVHSVVVGDRDDGDTGLAAAPDQLPCEGGVRFRSPGGPVLVVRVGRRVDLNVSQVEARIAHANAGILPSTRR